MEYYFEYGIRFPYDDRRSIQIYTKGKGEEFGHFSFKVIRYINDNRYTYYYYPMSGRKALMCLYFSLDLYHFNKGFHKYPDNFKYAQKTWPLLCNAYIRGKKLDYEEPAIQLLRDFESEDDFSEKWMLCKLVEFDSPKSMLLCSHKDDLCELIRYSNSMLSEILENNISLSDRLILSVESLFSNIVSGVGDGIHQLVGRSVETVSIKDNQRLANYARLCAHVYGTYSDSILPQNCLVIDKHIEYDTGLRVSLFKMQYEYVVAFAGTKTLKDWEENGKQVIGKSEQYEAALSYARRIMNKYSLNNLIFVGHSQGGGEAAYCAWNLGGRAITFNPAGLSLTTLLKGHRKVSSVSNIDSYVFANDILNVAQDIATQMIPVLGLCADGHVHYINDATPQSISLDEFHGICGILNYFNVNHYNND